MAWRRPLTVTGNDEKLVVIGDLVHHDVREGGHDLLFRREIGALLKLEIANGARQSQVPVDPSKVDEATGARDSRSLA